MRTLRTQSGFSVVEFFVLAVVVSILGFVSYGVYNRLAHKQSTDTATVQSLSGTPESKDVAEAPTITKTSDLDTALTTLDNTDPAASNSSDSAALDSELNGF